MSDAALDPAAAARLMKGATYASVAVASTLIAAKLAAWLATDQVSLLASLVDSLLDAMASLLNLFAVRQSLVPADAEHRFGHGKAEALAGLGQAVFIAVSALFLAVAAIQRLHQPVLPDHTVWGLGAMALSIVLTLALVLFQRHVTRRTGSVAVAADSLHYLSDLVTNSTVIAALLIVAWRPDLAWADPVGALLVAAGILWGAVAILRSALDHLMDREFDDDARAEIQKIVLAHPEARALHDLRTRQAGLHGFIQFHLELDGAISLSEAHRISDEIEAELLKRFPGADVIIHQDPAGHEDVPAAMR